MKVLQVAVLLVVMLSGITLSAQNEFEQSETNYWFDADEIKSRSYRQADASVQEFLYGTLTDEKKAVEFMFNSEGYLKNFKKEDDFHYRYKLNDTGDKLSAVLEYEGDKVTIASVENHHSELEVYENTYDTQGRIIKQKRTMPSDNDDYSVTTYEYGEDGKLKLMFTQNFFQGSEVGRYWRIYDHSANTTKVWYGSGKKRNKIEKMLEKNEVSDIKKYIYENGKIKKIEAQKDFTGDRDLESIHPDYNVEYTYDAQGRLKRKYKYPHEDVGIEYGDSYDKKNFTITEFIYNGNSKLPSEIRLAKYESEQNMKNDEKLGGYLIKFKYR